MEAIYSIDWDWIGYKLLLFSFYSVYLWLIQNFALGVILSLAEKIFKEDTYSKFKTFLKCFFISVVVTSGIQLFLILLCLSGEILGRVLDYLILSTIIPILYCFKKSYSFVYGEKVSSSSREKINIEERKIDEIKEEIRYKHYKKVDNI